MYSVGKQAKLEKAIKIQPLFEVSGKSSEKNEDTVILYFFDIFIHYAITVVPFLHLHSTPSCPPPHSHIPPL